jgi:hypothetical protein
MERCPVCDGPCGDPPRFDEAEAAARRQKSEMWAWFILIDCVVAFLVALLTWLR